MPKLLLLFLTALTAVAAPATFEVASMKVNKPGSAGMEGKVQEKIEHSPTSLTISNATLATCIKWAWNVEDFQISGGPSWFSSERYDIAAKVSAPVSAQNLRLLLRALLADRVHLALHSETKNLPVFALVESKGGAKVKPSSSDEAPTMRPVDGSLVFRNTSMASLASRFSGRPLKLERPVIDKTGLPGNYDFSLKFASDMRELKTSLEGMERGDSNGPSIFEVVQQQLGLKLEARKGNVEILVIERVERLPIDN